MKTILGQPSFTCATKQIRAAVTVIGGHLGPVTFKLGNRTIEPFSVAPWCREKLDPGTPNLLRVLRGDFFCLPFGGNGTPYRGEQHPPHGETANGRWKLEDSTKTSLHLSLKTKVRPGRVDKKITLIPDQTVIYQEHIITGMTGSMNFGHHAMLKFPDRVGAGRLSTSARAHCQVFLDPVERPEQKGYSLLKPGAVFNDLAAVPTITGELTDISRYPARRGFEDIAILVSDPRLPVAWTAVAFPEDGYVWFSLRDPRVLASTLLWMSNGGRYYAPWNGRHVNVMGVEDITGFFHTGLAESAAGNALSARGLRTHHVLHAQTPFTVKYVMGLAAIPPNFERVTELQVENGAVSLFGMNNVTVRTPVNTNFLTTK
jgi:hypothetical protein